MLFPQKQYQDNFPSFLRKQGITICCNYLDILFSLTSSNILHTYLNYYVTG